MSLEGMRVILKNSLGQSLGSLCDEDKLAAAWPVVCGKAIAERGIVVGYEDGILRIQVNDSAWLQLLTSLSRQFGREIAEITGVKVSEIHFEMKR